MTKPRSVPLDPKLAEMREARRKLPWFKFVGAHWLGDEKLRQCSLGARGLWMDMLAIMANSDEPGRLVICGKQPDHKALARLVGWHDPRTIKKHLEELLDNQVCSVDQRNIIYSRRMVRDWEVAHLGDSEDQVFVRGAKRREPEPDSIADPVPAPDSVPEPVPEAAPAPAPESAPAHTPAHTPESTPDAHSGDNSATNAQRLRNVGVTDLSQKTNRLSAENNGLVPNQPDFCGIQDSRIKSQDSETTEPKAPVAETGPEPGCAHGVRTAADTPPAHNLVDASHSCVISPIDPALTGQPTPPEVAVPSETTEQPPPTTVPPEALPPKEPEALPPQEPDEAQLALDEWNGVAAEFRLFRVSVLQPSTRAGLLARLRDVGGIAGWKAVMDQIRESQFLTGRQPGRDGRLFRVWLGFLLDRKRLQRLIEGGYQDHPIAVSAAERILDRFGSLADREME